MKQYIRKIKKISLNSGLSLIAVVISLFLCDSVLGFLNFPSELDVVYPKNYEKLIRNIEYQYVFKTNSRGLRYRDIPAKKIENTYRVFVSGDSFVEGQGVAEGKRFTDLLENRFNSFPSSILFINGGLVGTGPLEYGRAFLNVGLKYNPDALLICLYVNDVSDTPTALAEPFADYDPARTGIRKIAHDLWPHVYTILLKSKHHVKYYRTSNQIKTSGFISTVSKEAIRRKTPQPEIERWKTSLPRELVDAVNQGYFNGSILSEGLFYPKLWSDSIDISSDVARKRWKNMTRTLSEILVRAKRSRIETAVVLIPVNLMYDPKSHSDKNPWIIAGYEIRSEWLRIDTEIQRKMLLWARSEGVPFLDLTPVFRKAIQSNGNLNYELDGHWNDLGHQIAAEAIASWLLNEQVFSFVKRKGLTFQ